MTYELESAYRSILLQARAMANVHYLAKMSVFVSVICQWLPAFGGGSPGILLGFVAILAFGIYKKTLYITDFFEGPGFVQTSRFASNPAITVKPAARYEQIPQITRSLSPGALKREIGEDEYLLLNEALRRSYLKDAKLCVASELEKNGSLNYAVFCRVVLYVAAKELWLSNEERKQNARMAINEMLQPSRPQEPIEKEEIKQPTRNWRRVSIEATPLKECADES